MDNWLAGAVGTAIDLLVLFVALYMLTWIGHAVYGLGSPGIGALIAATVALKLGAWAIRGRPGVPFNG